jgi:RHS repeat-associated protein
MAGISTNAQSFGSPKNTYKYNEGTELNTTFDIHFYETNFRTLDPQIGRFHQIDPMSEAFENLSLYGYANSNPILLNDPFGLASDTITMPNATVVAKYKYLDTENGQVLSPISFLASLFSGQRSWNGISVDRRGYLEFLPDGTPAPIITMFIMPDPGSKASVRKVTKIVVNKWLVYRAYKKVNGRLKQYIGKAKESLKKRYTAKEIDDMGARVINQLDNLPDNATALGVEQAILDLNGGIGQTANKINATIKQVYKDAGLKWLNENIPNWKEVFKF